MSTTIDERVVEMRFDNRHFESNVSTTMSTLEKLKQSLSLKGASQGLENVSTAAKNCDVSMVGRAAETVGLKFNAMYTMADQALRNITNSAVNYGKRIVSALTIDPVKMGFKEYETQINAVQTILANTESKGTTLDDVNSALDELNAYADKTIYNFTEMTRNIGTFTAAGVDLDTSVNAIQGIANLAAVSGSTSQQASTAMYQLSQAMSSGTVRLMDWNSVVNAGMGGQVFQDALKETAKVHGVAIDDIIAKQGSFRESLSEGWLTTEILTDTLSKFTMAAEEGSEEWNAYKKSLKEQGYTEEQAEKILKMANTATDAATKVKTFSQLFDTLKEAAQSGWTQTWEILVGDFEEAKELLTSISDTIGAFIGKTAEARNEMLENWKVMGGREVLIEALKNAFEGLVSVATPIREAFREMFPPMTSSKLLKLTESFRNFTSKLKLSDEASDNLKRTFKGLFAILDIIGQVFGAVFKAISPLLGSVDDLGGGILGVTAVLGDCLVWLSEFLRESGLLKVLATGIASGFKLVITVVKAFVKLIKTGITLGPLEALKAFISEFRFGLEGAKGDTESFASAISTAFGNLGEALKNNSLVRFLMALWKVVKTLVSIIGKVLGNLIGGLADRLANADFEGILEFINTLSLSAILAFLAKFVKGLSDGVGTFNEFKEGVMDIMGGVTGAFKAFQNSLNAEAIKKLATAVAILAVSLLVLSLIDRDRLMDAIVAISILFYELTIAMKTLKTSGEVFSKDNGTIALVMMGISFAVLLLASALKKISGLDADELKRGLLGISIMLAALFGVLVGLKKLLKGGAQAKTLTASVKALLPLVIAVYLLASVCKKLGKMSWEELARGLVGVTVLLAVLFGMLVGLKKLLKNGAQADTLTKSIKALLPLVLALYILASACKMLGKLSWEEWGRGMLGVTILLAALSIVLVGLKKLCKGGAQAGTLLKSVGAIMMLAGAIMIIVPPLMLLSMLSWPALAKAAAGLAGILVLLVGSIAVLSLLKGGTLKAAGSAMMLAAVIAMLVPPFMLLGAMKWENIAKGAVALVTILGSIVVAVGLLSLMGGGLSAAAAIVAISAALIGLTGVLLVLGAMSWDSIVKGLVTIAGAFAIIGVAGMLLSPIVGPIVLLAAAIALIGAGILGAGLGLIAFGVGLTAISGGLIAFAAAATVIAKSLPIIVTALVGVVSALVVGIIKGIGEGIVALCELLLDSIPLIGQVLKSIVVTLIDVLIECVPMIASGLFKLIVSLLEILVDYAPTIVELLIQFLVNIINSIADNLGPLIQAATKLFMTFITEVVNALGDLDAGSLENLFSTIGMMTGIMAALAAMAVLAPLAMVGIVGMAVVVAELSAVLAALGLIAQIPGLEWLISEGGDFLQKVGTAIGQFVGGIVGGFMGGVSSQLPKMATDLSAFMTNLRPFIEGAKSIDSSMVSGLAALVGAILLITGASLLERITSWVTGESSIANFAVEIVKLGEGLKGFADAVEGINPESITAAANAAKALAEMTSYIPNSGGVVSWFVGDNSISAFAGDLVTLGESLKGFSDSVTGINPENMTAAANAAKVLAEMTNTIPNSGGVSSWFAGENSISKFGSDLVALGEGLKGFSDAIVGVNPENLTAAATAAKCLADMTNAIPNSGGIATWFAGDNSVARFSSDLVTLGEGLKGFSDAIVGVNPENMTAAANAAKALAEMSNSIPNSGGVTAWFAGENSIAKFAVELVVLGVGLKSFSNSVAGINPENITAAANAAKNLADMTNTIPSEGGIKAWFTGESSISKFAGNLPKLGKGLKGFSDNVAGINPENISAASKAAKTLAQMADKAPSDLEPMVNFGNKLKPFGEKLKGYFNQIAKITGDSISASTKAINAVKKASGINAGSIESSAKAISSLTKSIKGMSGVNKATAENFTNAVKAIAKASSEEFAKSFNKLDEKMSKIGKSAISEFVKAVNSKKPDVVKAGTNLANAFAEGIVKNNKTISTSFNTLINGIVLGIQGKYTSMYSAGSFLVSGLAAGISANAPTALSRARALANSVASAMRKALRINSPSKVGYEIGDFYGLGFVNALGDYEGVVYKTSYEMGDSAKSGLGDAISKMRDFIESDMDTQPTIRPVLDLSDVRSGANAIGGLFGESSLGVLANVGSISSAMNRNGQNGGNDDVVSAINDLRKDISKLEMTSYNVGDVTYDDGSNIIDAVKSLIRAAKIERRI